MLRLILRSSALLILFASTTHAGQGVNMRWTNCFGDGGAFNRNFACLSNTGNNPLVGSFVLGQPMSGVAGTETTIDLAAASPTLPAWWAFRNSGTCRQTALHTDVIPPTAVACVDWSNEQAVVFVTNYTIGFNGPSTPRIAAVSGVANTNLFANQEYFAFNIVIHNTNTVGAGACAGCSVPVCLRLGSIKLTTTTSPANDRVLNGPTNGTDSHFVTWQNGAASCLSATPSRRGTWGAVKSLYR